MNEREVRACWEGNADAWTTLARRGYDVYRDFLNTPAFLAMLPDVAGRNGLDIGCGEGHNTRRLAGCGAHVTAIDVSTAFLQHAANAQNDAAQPIRYCAASALALPFPANAFDFITGFMSFMDVGAPEPLFAEAYRVLGAGGFLQFSISHPCFDTPHRRNLRDARGVTYAIEVGDYYRNRDGEIDEWLFSAAPGWEKAGLPPFRTPTFTFTLSRWLNALMEAGFNLERVEEPRPSDETVRACPRVQDAQVVSYFLHIRARKIGAG